MDDIDRAYEELCAHEVHDTLLARVVHGARNAVLRSDLTPMERLALATMALYEQPFRQSLTLLGVMLYGMPDGETRDEFLLRARGCRDNVAKLLCQIEAKGHIRTESRRWPDGYVGKGIWILPNPSGEIHPALTI
ncbi:hypothetical protein ACG83_09150 [Frankia sp. R43]|uniref:hypothetical protein n=1 Tax=Frankia sp. R43 TaxID=269536 RepID=UPI0006CA1827|nr:hypothetical protein [Frankia sp. R43]KPM55485.1 hypothetical protein ACG83_09150 [Frankia sp. R43]